MSLDLVQFDTKAAAEAGTKVFLDNPFTGDPMLDDEGNGYYIEILGGDSEKVFGALRNINDKRLERIQKTRRIVTDSEASRLEDINTMAAASLSWYLPPIDGAELTFSEQNARRLYADLRFPWIMEQLEKVIGDRKRFFKKNSKASSNTVPGTAS
jgi:hypothetical protein